MVNLNDKKIVWVLGAGFSRSLGAPLLPQLFSDTSLDKARAIFPKEEFVGLHHGDVWHAHRLYHWGREFRDYKSGAIREGEHGRSVWEDAEQFLDYIDVALNSKNAAAFLNNAYLNSRGKTLDLLVPAARRLLAAECCAFLEGADLKTEKWGPYRRWINELVGSGDTIVTFNYDRAVELLAAHEKRELDVLLPKEVRERNGKPRILKLHGSVDWDYSEQEGTISSTNPHHAIILPETAVLGTPGPSKQTLAENLLKNIWSDAKEVLHQADAIVFVGYRFPKTDAQSRFELLNAILQNVVPKNLHIHTVLGPYIKDLDTVRLEALLRHSIANERKPAEEVTNLAEMYRPHTYKISIQPFWTEDFFSLLTRDHILV